MMAAASSPQTVLLDPLTRIEGHLAVKTQIVEGRVVQAHLSGVMFRGFEAILRGRSPTDAQHITQRVCGVCSVEHGIASVLAQDMAFGVRPPRNGRVMRNLMQAANYLASHITHFYLLSALDFIDVAAVANYTGEDPRLRELKAWVAAEAAAKKVLPVAPFLPRYAGDYARDAALNFGALRHYLEALEMRAAAQRLGAIFAGKLPHAATLVPGGVTERVDALRVEEARTLVLRLRAFIHEAYVPDVVAVAQAFPQYFSLGCSPGGFLAYGVFPESDEGGRHFLSGGVVRTERFAALDRERIREDVAHAYFSSASGRHPTAGETVAAPDKRDAYSWLKAPRYDGQPMEVGPLARLLVAAQSGLHPEVAKALQEFCGRIGRKPSELNSVMGRHAARALEAALVVERCERWLDELRPDEPTATTVRPPQDGSGYGLTEAARGALGHWLEIGAGKITRYQLVVPTTWNASPRDDQGVPGPIEAALVGTPVAEAANPIEVARVVRSFDPCLACAVH